MVLENYEIAQTRMGINDGRFDVLFRDVAYDLKATNWKTAREEAKKILNKKFPKVSIYLM